MNANRKRQHDENNFDDDEPQAQRNNNNNSQQQPMKITDVIDDCLLKIFDYLDSASLFNVAVANERLRPTASMIYKRKFGAMEVKIKSNKSYWAHSVPFKVNDVIHVIDLKMTLQFLRCLGPSIDHLSIFHHGFNEKQIHHIYHYINEYCAENLVFNIYGNVEVKYLTQYFFIIQVQVNAIQWFCSIFFHLSVSKV